MENGVEFLWRCPLNIPGKMFDMETWNPEKSGQRWKICMYGRCFESESGLKRGQVKRGGLRSECWDGQLLSVGRGCHRSRG